MAEELGTRDVLEQVDARLQNTEQDMRETRSGMETRFNWVDAKFDQVDTRFDQVHQEISGLRWDMAAQARWLVGLFFAGWMSMVASIWLKL
jgi:hypothetical protein